MEDVDFKSLILELQSRGLTQYFIADYVGCSQGYISDIVRGRSKGMVGFKRGLKLIEMERNTRKIVKIK